MKKLYTIAFVLLFTRCTYSCDYSALNSNQIDYAFTQNLIGIENHHKQELATLDFINSIFKVKLDQEMEESVFNKINKGINDAEKVYLKYPSPEVQRAIEIKKEENRLLALIFYNIKTYNDPTHSELKSLAQQIQYLDNQLIPLKPEIKRLVKKYNDSHSCTIS